MRKLPKIILPRLANCFLKYLSLAKRCSKTSSVVKNPKMMWILVVWMEKGRTKAKTPVMARVKKL